MSHFESTYDSLNSVIQQKSFTEKAVKMMVQSERLCRIFFFSKKRKNT